MDIKSLLKATVQLNASDLHIAAGVEPQVRVDGQLELLDIPIMDDKEVEALCYSVITEKQKKELEEEKELDFAISIEGIGRFRINYYFSNGTIAAAVRVIPEEIPSLEDINAPEIYREFIKKERGLVLVTGPTGSGKTTTIAAMLGEVNKNSKKHILCIEDPVEFMHANKKALFSFRTVGEDTKSFARALKSSLREDPDIIYVGELRDKETISAALTAAETGHLVFGSLHTNSAPQTINRILDVFSGDEQPQARAQLSVTLIAVISQVLIPKIGGGRVCANEILVNNPAIGNLIREQKVHQIPSQMLIGQGMTGMQTQTQILERLVKDKLITREHAFEFAAKPEELKGRI